MKKGSMEEIYNKLESFKTQLSEGEQIAYISKSSTRAINRIYKQTDNNDGSGALLTLARYVGISQYIDVATEIENYHNYLNSIPYEISTYRYQLVGELLEVIKKSQGKEMFEKFKQSF